MEFKEIASISGKGGLFKVIKPTRTGVIVEEISPEKKRMVAGLKNRVSLLDEIGIYTQTADGAKPLKEVMQTMFKEFKGDLGVDANDDPEELKAFLTHVVPDYDTQKVYVSDIKKLINWYLIIFENFPELLEEEKQEEKEKASSKSAKKEESEDPKTETKSSKSTTKTTTKKSPTTSTAKKPAPKSKKEG